jgi:hypothetical protein
MSSARQLLLASIVVSAAEALLTDSYQMCATGGVVNADMNTAGSASVECSQDNGATWNPIADMDVARYEHASAFFNGQLCVSGGRVGAQNCQYSVCPGVTSVECTSDGSVWNTVAPLSQARFNHGMATWTPATTTAQFTAGTSYLCVSGGRNSGASIADIECTSDLQSWFIYSTPAPQAVEGNSAF